MRPWWASDHCPCREAYCARSSMQRVAYLMPSRLGSRSCGLNLWKASLKCVITSCMLAPVMKLASPNSSCTHSSKSQLTYCWSKCAPTKMFDRSIDCFL